jgi:hypothetical protein
MPVLFDPTDDFVSGVLDRAKLEGEISLPDLETIVEGGLEDKDSISPRDIGDTVEALAKMGIEIDDGLTQEQRDEELCCAMKKRVAEGYIISPTFEAMDSLARVVNRKKRGIPDPSPEEVAERRKILAERTWIQTLFADLGPRILRERRGQW